MTMEVNMESKHTEKKQLRYIMKPSRYSNKISMSMCVTIKRIRQSLNSQLDTKSYTIIFLPPLWSNISR